jgi:hypothetical protein
MIPQLAGSYVYTDFCSGRVRAVDAITSGGAQELLVDSDLSVTSFAETSTGDLLLADYSGDVYQLAFDADGDGYGDPVDNCPIVVNDDQLDTEGDGWGDVCDNCEAASNADQADVDSDEVGDVCDNCPTVPNPNQANHDTDSLGDACDDDSDDDGLSNDADNCPTVPNLAGQQDDVDGDLAGDDCDGSGSGNVDCSAPPNGVTSVDALKVLRHSAALPFAQSEPCLDVGLPRLLSPPDNRLMGDVNCSGGVNSVDALLILRTTAGLVASIPQDCPAIKP